MTASLPMIILTGFMGTGKTEVGRELADLLRLDFLDTDELIERREGMKVAELFRRKGEEHFREAEGKVCAELAGRSGLVVAAGGGILMSEANRRALSRAGRLILLTASCDEIVRRIGGSGDRPLLEVKGGRSPASGEKARAPAGAPELKRRVQELLKSREASYAAVKARIDTTGLGPRDVAFRIAASLKLPCERIEMCAGGSRGAVRGSRDPAVRTPSAVSEPQRALGGSRGAESGTRSVESGPGGAQRVPPSDGTVSTTIEIGRGLLSRLGELLRCADLGAKTFILIPDRVREHFLAQIGVSLEMSSIMWEEVPVRDGESEKTIRQVGEILDALASGGAERDSVAVAVGGGVTGDLAGFAASIYMRGIPLVHVPTTLLAQVDSSVGGKVGVNHPRAKNLIGAFHQPRLVVSDPCALRTLPLGEVSNGMAEVIKTAIIGSPDLFAFIEDSLFPEGRSGGPDAPLVAGPKAPPSAKHAARGPDAPPATRPGRRSQVLRDVAFLERCVAECAAVKARIVEADPYERGGRRVLNLGHTPAHAIEAAGEYSAMTHGEAVSIGLVAALRISARRGLAGDELLQRSRRMLAGCGLPVEAPGLDEGAILRALSLDKKRASGRMRFVLAAGLGSTVVVDDVSEAEVVESLRGEAS